MNQFFEAFANMFRIADLRKRILFTLAMLAVYGWARFCRRRASIPTC